VSALEDGSNVPSMDPDLERRLKATARRLGELGDLRDQLLIQAHEEGGSLREIAAVAGMSHVGIKKLLTRHLHPDRIREIDEDKKALNLALNQKRTADASKEQTERR
jgi:hypothetical protein